jgi:hypothetical protein
MKTTYHLTDEELSKVVFVPRLVSKRIDQRPSYIKPGVGTFEEPWGTGRTDMFWIACFFESEDLGSLVIQPLTVDPKDFIIEQNWCKIEPFDKIAKLARNWFLKQPEYRMQTELVEKLKELKEEDKKNGYNEARLMIKEN